MHAGDFLIFGAISYKINSVPLKIDFIFYTYAIDFIIFHLIPINRF